ncbi:hypothetical protein BACCOPRO_01283 [Phocaeicola coprophilus DSM 18228 = JCM 13818]|uniref:Uncharacterized protein n=1 Tax=Phocaeicola coprophilus DSM 18228 = JCM 13818 TaxID=547042 RepID=S0FBB7_9BACT|nr:hypothetical protein BACCOPRO_01283 [Phocaeicola coprophilus DSM 18228 = JCM 13818]
MLSLPSVYKLTRNACLSGKKGNIPCHGENRFVVIPYFLFV